jgi:DNA-binding NarL/FixJ family response regulator
MNKSEKLDNRKKVILKLVAGGATIRTIAKVTGVSSRTISAHLKEIRAEYQARNDHHLIYKVYKAIGLNEVIDNG